MLQELKLEAFKSFASQTVPFDRLTLLVGANASGKSNVFDALRFLQGIAMDLPIGEVLRGRWEGGREVWPGIRGGSAEVARGAEKLFSLETKWLVPIDTLSHQIVCEVGAHPRLAGETLSSAHAGKYLFHTEAESLGARSGLQPGGAIAVALRRKGRSGRSVRETLSSERSACWRWFQPAQP